MPVWQLEWKKVEPLLITSSLSRVFFLEGKLVAAGEARNIPVQLRYSCVYGSMYIHIAHQYYPVVPWFFIARSSLAFHLIVVEAISLLVEHLKNQFWISSPCFNLLQTLNGALLLWELET